MSNIFTYMRLMAQMVLETWVRCSAGRILVLRTVHWKIVTVTYGELKDSEGNTLGGVEESLSNVCYELNNNIVGYTSSPYWNPLPMEFSKWLQLPLNLLLSIYATIMLFLVNKNLTIILVFVSKNVRPNITYSLRELGTIYCITGDKPAR